jgi:hypothetical protein
MLTAEHNIDPASSYPDLLWNIIVYVHEDAEVDGLWLNLLDLQTKGS